MICRICGYKKSILSLEVKEMMFGSGKRYSYSQCGNCEVLQRNTEVTDSELLYPSNYYSFQDEKLNLLKENIKKYIFIKIVQNALGFYNLIGQFFRLFRPSLDAASLKDFVSKDLKILDVGCGSGSLIHAMAGLGFKYVEGLDPYIPKEINDHRIKIYKKYLSELNNPGYYDLIMLHHSFEHMEDPSSSLKEIFRLLKPGGICVIRIPVADSYAFEYYKENWVQLDAPRHIFLHTNKSIAILANQNCFDIVKIIDDSTSFQIIGSEQYIKEIPLQSEDSHFQKLHKQWFGIKSKVFTRSEIKKFCETAKLLREKGRGDQKCFILKKNAIST